MEEQDLQVVNNTISDLGIKIANLEIENSKLKAQIKLLKDIIDAAKGDENDEDK